MLLAVDLHLHSRHASGVSPRMTLPNLAKQARRKGIDVLGTGDCLQAEWLGEITSSLIETGSGFLALQPEIEEASSEGLAPHLQRPVHFVLSTEVCCAPVGTPELGGLHHLIYFRSIESARRFRSRLTRFGDLQDGRPTLTLNSRELLELVIDHGDGCELAPAHVLNPWYSILGSVSGARTPGDWFGDLAPRLLAVEMGLTSTPDMGRRIAALDGHTLFCCSDAHSPEKIGREYTLVDIELNYAELMGALRGTADGVRGFVKVPVERTRYYRNWCGSCRRSFDGTICPECGRRLAVGSRDRLEAIADRTPATASVNGPTCYQLLPLTEVIAEIMGVDHGSKAVHPHYDRLLGVLGHERYILTEATEDEIADVATREVARMIVAQRMAPLGRRRADNIIQEGNQLALGL